MNMNELDEKIYYDDSVTKVTASFVADYRKVIFPVERIKDVIVTHKSYSMYMAFLCCIFLILMLFLAPLIPPIGKFEISTEMVWYLFIPLFGTCCIWFRFIYENYVELYVVLDDDSKKLLRIITLGKRTIIYDIAEAIQSARQDRLQRSREEKLLDTDSLKLRRLRNMAMETSQDLTPELLALLNPASANKAK